jgi:site-specific recombinase XerD
MFDVAIIDPPASPAVVEEEMATSRNFALNEKADATRKAYRSDAEHFVAWCDARGLASLPAAPDAVAAYLSSPATTGARASTIGRRMAAIRYMHKLAGHEPSTNQEAVKAVMRGIRRTIGTAKVQKHAATADLVGAMLAAIPDTMIGKRDRALLALGFAGAFRRSELVALQVEDLVETPDGFRVVIRKSKTDQEGAGQEIAVLRGCRLRPVAAVQAWLEATGITSGPLFRPISKGGVVASAAMSGQPVAEVIKRRAEAVGLDSAVFSGHSLRSGFLTSAAESDAGVFKMMEVSRHKSVDTLKGYVRRADLFREHAGAAFL